MPVQERAGVFNRECPDQAVDQEEVILPNVY